MSFEQLSEDLVRLEEKVDEIASTCSAIVPKVNRAEGEVFGNGRPSLSTQIAELKTTQRLALKVLGAIGIAGLGLLGSIAVKIIFFAF